MNLAGVGILGTFSPRYIAYWLCCVVDGQKDQKQMTIPSLIEAPSGSTEDRSTLGVQHHLQVHPPPVKHTFLGKKKKHKLDTYQRIF